MLTINEFNDIPAGRIISTGVLPNSPDGLFMTNNGGELRWVAVKGHADDWTIYCHWSYNSIEWIRQSGDKVITEVHIKRCVPCDDQVFKSYRY